MNGRHGDRTTGQQSPRRLAVLCLTAWDSQRQPIQIYLDALVHQGALPQKDRQLAVMLVNGVLRRMQELDVFITGFSRFPLAKMKRLTLMTLRVGVYQLLFLDRIPESAAVNETVQVMKAEKQPRWLISFVNGVLRSAVRSLHRGELWPAGLPPADTILNHPSWLVDRWRRMYGDRVTELICRCNNREPRLVLRVNTGQTGAADLAARLAEAGYGTRPGKYAPGCMILEELSGSVTRLPGYREGLFHVQDEGAQLVTMLCGPFTPGSRYLDACAGVGGKSCQLAQLKAEGGEIIAVEPHGSRYDLLRQNLQRLGLSSHVQPFPGHLREMAGTDPGRFDVVLVDAPCSGTGVIGRHPDIRWNRRPEDLQAYQRQQLELMDEAWSLLAAGGVLVYATCSMEPEENREVVASVLERHQDLVLTDCLDYLPESARELVDEDGFFSSTPAQGLDGFFAARLVRRI